MPKKDRQTVKSSDVGILDLSMLNGPKIDPATKENTMNDETATTDALDTPAIQASDVLKTRGRKAGTKVTNIVKHSDFIPKYREYHAAGLGFDEMATKFGLGKMTVIQKRLAYNKASLEAGHPINLPLPASTGTRGAKKIDWTKFTTNIEESVN